MIWPLTKPEFGSYEWLMREVGDLMQVGAKDSTWTHEEHGRIDSLVQRGVRQFYSPPPLPGERYGYDWSFLRPVLALDTVAEQAVYDLPVDWAMFRGPLVFLPDQNTSRAEVDITSLHRLMGLQTTKATGPPRYAATRAKELDPAVGTRYELVLYPEPDDEYHLQAPARLNPGDLSEGQFPYGGSVHYETVRASCISVATQGDANAMQLFLQRLATSVGHDRKVNSPDTLGRDYDHSDVVEYPGLIRTGFQVVAYKGVTS